MTAPLAPRGARRGETGQALAAALLALLLIALGMALVAASLSLRMRTALREVRGVHATALADAALAATLANLAEDPTYPGLPETAFAGGTFSSRVRELGFKSRVVTLDATYGGVRRRAVARVDLTPSGLLVRRWRRTSIGGE